MLCRIEDREILTFAVSGREKPPHLAGNLKFFAGDGNEGSNRRSLGADLPIAAPRAVRWGSTSRVGAV